MDLRKLKTLIDLVAESAITELEVTEGEGKVRIVKAPAGVAAAPVVMAAAPQVAALPAAATAPAQAAAPAAPAAEAEPQGHVVKSPMVGTFYRAAAPGKPAFVEVGASVTAGQTVCIIEAMKLLNEIEAGADGVIKKILVENGQPVEYGQPLFIIG
ncbi:MAG TPA: acetyl-CoA carboxylase biotin carboxyl carrier protein [Burkholderiaceae bacterium]|nr:acetyl-CoA carboxylase biotin carboxyl carrier protein [Burkholderiaceae bacterium]